MYTRTNTHTHTHTHVCRICAPACTKCMSTNAIQLYIQARTLSRRTYKHERYPDIQARTLSRRTYKHVSQGIYLEAELTGYTAHLKKQNKKLEEKYNHPQNTVKNSAGTLRERRRIHRENEPDCIFPARTMARAK